MPIFEATPGTTHFGSTVIVLQFLIMTVSRSGMKRKAIAARHGLIVPDIDVFIEDHRDLGQALLRASQHDAERLLGVASAERLDLRIRDIREPARRGTYLRDVNARALQRPKRSASIAGSWSILSVNQGASRRSCHADK